VFRRARDWQQQPPRELTDDRAQLIDEAHEVVTPLLCEHRQQPDSLSRTLLDDETLGAPADARPPEWRRLPPGRTHRKPSRALMTPLPPPVEFRCRDRRVPCRRVAPRPERLRYLHERLTCVDTASTGKTGVVIGVLERERDRAAGTPADRCRKRIRSVKKLVARRD
jgi:hypothetical protein